MGFINNLFKELSNSSDFKYERNLELIKRAQSKPVQEAIARIKGDLQSRMLQSKSRETVRQADQRLAKEDQLTSQLERFFARNMAALIGLFTKLEGEEYPQLGAFVKHFFVQLGYTPESVQKYENLVMHVTEKDVKLREVVEFINHEFNPNDKEDVVEMLYSLALLNGDISEQEEAFIQLISEEIDIENLSRLEIRATAFASISKLQRKE